MEIARPLNQLAGKEEEDSNSFEFPLVIYMDDSLFNSNGKWQILPFKQTGINLPGHYLKIEKTDNSDGSKSFKVSASATRDDPKSVFNIYTVSSSQGGYIEIIESALYPQKVLAVVNDQVVVKTCKRPPQKYHRMRDILATEPEILWIYEPIALGSIFATYRLYNTGSTNYYLAFGSNGKPLTPSTVEPIRDQAFFSEQPKAN